MMHLKEVEVQCNGGPLGFKLHEKLAHLMLETINEKKGKYDFFERPFVLI